MVEVKPINLKSKKELKKYIKFEWEVYKNDKNWVPPLIIDMLSKFDSKKNPLFEHADIQPYIAYKDGKPAGRITAIIHHRHNQFHNEKVVFFGFFDVFDDFDIARALLDTVAEFGMQKGMTVMRGPASFSSNDMWGLLIENFDEPPIVMMPYNPPYYKDLLERYGLVKAKDLLAYKLVADEVQLPERVAKMVEYLKTRSDIVVRKINMKKFNEEVEKIRIIYNDAWEKNWGFIPMTEKEFEHLAKDLKTVVIPDLAFIAEVRGEPAGFSLTLPDANQALKHINGRLLPFGIFKLLYYFKKIDRGRLITLGVRKQFQKRGIEALFYYYSLEEGRRLGWKWAELSWVLEDNELMKRGIELMGGRAYKKYRIYEKNI